MRVSCSHAREVHARLSIPKSVVFGLLRFRRLGRWEGLTKAFPHPCFQENLKGKRRLKIGPHLNGQLSGRRTSLLLEAKEARTAPSISPLVEFWLNVGGQARCFLPRRPPPL